MKIVLAITIFDPISPFSCYDCLIVMIDDSVDSGFKRDNCEGLLYVPNVKNLYQHVSIKIDFWKILS